MKPLHWVLATVFGAVIPLVAKADLDRKIEVQARGPLHEAYAQPWEANPSPNQPISQQPPAPIAEEPPDERPKGTNVQWIPGYWQWDSDKKDFVWTSGFWRDPPSGRRWVPGTWARTAEGFRWIGGHWAGGPERDFQFVGPPPTNPDRGPTSRPPDADSFYIPGTWFYGENGYAYRDGYWAGCRPGYLWMPARYFWTPYGWCFTSGYWDYALGARGLLFAPVCFPNRAYLAAGFVFRPAFAVSFNAFFGSFFVGPGYGHYYFGDFYGPHYASHGIHPWVSYSSRSFDPIFAHERWANSNNPNWLAGQQSTLSGRINGTLSTPARTLADQGSGKSPAMLSSLEQMRKSGVRFDTLTGPQRALQSQNAGHMTARGNALIQHSGAGGFGAPSSQSGITTSFKPSFGGVNAGPTTSGSSTRIHTGGTSMPSISAPMSRPQFTPSFQGGRMGSGGSMGGSRGGGSSHGGHR